MHNLDQAGQAPEDDCVSRAGSSRSQRELCADPNPTRERSSRREAGARRRCYRRPAFPLLSSTGEEFSVSSGRGHLKGRAATSRTKDCYRLKARLQRRQREGKGRRWKEGREGGRQASKQARRLGRTAARPSQPCSSQAIPAGRWKPPQRRAPLSRHSSPTFFFLKKKLGSQEAPPPKPPLLPADRKCCFPASESSTLLEVGERKASHGRRRGPKPARIPSPGTLRATLHLTGGREAELLRPPSGCANALKAAGDASSRKRGSQVGGVIGAKEERNGPEDSGSAKEGKKEGGRRARDAASPAPPVLPPDARVLLCSGGLRRSGGWIFPGLSPKEKSARAAKMPSKNRGFEGPMSQWRPPQRFSSPGWVL